VTIHYFDLERFAFSDTGFLHDGLGQPHRVTISPLLHSGKHYETSK
jgi:hypothetical protein